MTSKRISSGINPNPATVSPFRIPGKTEHRHRRYCFTVRTLISLRSVESPVIREIGEDGIFAGTAGSTMAEINRHKIDHCINII